MREDLAREFPEAGRASAWMRGRFGGRRPVFWDEPIPWAAVSGIGAGFLVAAVAQAIVGLATQAFHSLGGGPLPFTLFSLTSVAATAAASAVTLGIGGIAAFALYLAYLAFGVALGIPGVMAFCERSGEFAFPLPLPDQCTPLSFVTSLWPQLVGIGIGIAVSRAVVPRGAGINSLLRIAGGFAIAQFVMSQVWSATVETANPLASGLTFAAGLAAAAVAAGVLAAQVPRGIRNAVIVGGIWLVPWLTLQIPLGLRSLEPTLPAEFVGPIILTMAMPPIAVACLVLSAAITSRARFIPRDAA
jgi:hypothetical protein